MIDLRPYFETVRAINLETGDMRATLEFDLDVPEERTVFDLSREGPKYYLALDAVGRAFRDKAKHAEPQETTWAEAKQLFWDTLLAEGVELD